MGFYDNAARKAYAVIKKRGVAMVLRRTIPASINANTGVMGTTTVTDYNCFGLIQYFDSKASALMYGSTTLKDTLIKKEDQMIMLAAYGLPVNPQSTTDRLIFLGSTYTVVNVLPLQPGGVAIFHNVHVRK